MSIKEFFNSVMMNNWVQHIAVIEAILTGCKPILPNIFSYPELIPTGFHSYCLDINEIDLKKKLKITLKGDTAFKQKELIDRMLKLCWSTMICEYDSLINKIISGENLK